MDKLTICKRCGSDACYSQEVNDSITNYQCMGCGFVSNSLMKPNSDFLNEQSEVLPELYKDLFFEDKDGYIWMPSTVNIPTMGMIFANGSNKDTWGWSAVKSVPMPEEEAEKFKEQGKDYKWKMDMETIQHFNERNYIDALEYIGVFAKQ